MNKIAVYFDPCASVPVDSYSPSASKPAAALAAWRSAKLPIEVLLPTPATWRDLHTIHDRRYVDDVRNGKRPNGFDTVDDRVNGSLLYTSGAMRSAAFHAAKFGVACAPVSGFHHARYDGGGGFCTFNGLMLAAKAVLDARQRAVGWRGRVMILDCDQHEGDGTDSVMTALGMRDQIDHVTFGRWYSSPRDATAYLGHLAAVTSRFRDVDLVLYQAGADVHVDDPLGGVLTTAQMLERDRLVFEAARAARVPIAWNLAGGYQKPIEKVLALHTQTMRECARVFA